jgi:hypothetical protein
MSWYHLVIFCLFLFSLPISGRWWQGPSTYKRDNRRKWNNWVINSKGHTKSQLLVRHLQTKRLCAKGESFNFNNSKHNNETHKVTDIGGNHFQLLRFLIKLGIGWARKSSNCSSPSMPVHLWKLASINTRSQIKQRDIDLFVYNDPWGCDVYAAWTRRSRIWISLASYLSPFLCRVRSMLRVQNKLIP